MQNLKENELIQTTVNGFTGEKKVCKVVRVFEADPQLGVTADVQYGPDDLMDRVMVRAAECQEAPKRGKMGDAVKPDHGDLTFKQAYKRYGV